MRTAILLSSVSVAFAAPAIIARGGSWNDSHKGGKTVIVSSENNSQHNGQGSGGLLGLGVDALNNDNIGGISNAQGDQGNNNGGISVGSLSPGLPAPVAPVPIVQKKTATKNKDSKVIVLKEDNSQHNGQGSGLIGVGADLLNNDNILGISNAQGDQGNGNGNLHIARHWGESNKKGKTVIISKEDNSQHNGQGSGLIGVGADLLNDDNILGITNAQGDQGNSNGNVHIARRWSGSDKKGKTVIVSKEDNSQHNGQGSGLIGVGIDAGSNDNILGLTNAQGDQGNSNGNISAGQGSSGSTPVKKKTTSGSKSSTVISKEDNSQHNGQGKGALLGVGVDALNCDNILGASNAQCDQGNSNGGISL